VTQLSALVHSHAIDYPHTIAVTQQPQSYPQSLVRPDSIISHTHIPNLIQTQKHYIYYPPISCRASLNIYSPGNYTVLHITTVAASFSHLMIAHPIAKSIVHKIVLLLLYFFLVTAYDYHIAVMLKLKYHHIHYVILL